MSKKQQYTRERVEVIFRLRDKTSKGETREDLLKEEYYTGKECKAR